MDIKNLVDKLVDKIAKKDEFTFSPKNYVMAEIYDAENLVVGKLEVISSDVTEFGPMVKKTSQNYIFEPIVINGVIKYQEIFTGFIAGDSAEGYFDLPYVVDMVALTEILVDYKQEKIPKLGMLLTLNDVNSQMVKRDDENILNKRKAK